MPINIRLSNVSVSRDSLFFGDYNTDCKISFRVTNVRSASNSSFTNSYIYTLLVNIYIAEKDFGVEDSSLIAQYRIGTYGDNKTPIMNIGESVDYNINFVINKDIELYNKFVEWRLANPEVREVPLRLVVRANTAKPSASVHGEVRASTNCSLNLRYNLSIPVFTADRANEDGSLNDEGTKLLTDLRLNLGEGEHYSHTNLTLYYEENGDVTENSSSLDLSDYIQDALSGSGIVDSMNLIPDEFSKSSDWNLMLKFSDEYDSVYARYNVAKAFANVHLAGVDTGGVAFGKFSSATEGNPLFECQYPAEFEGESNFNAPAIFNAGIQGVTNFPDLRSADGTITLPVSVEELTGGRWIDGKPIYRFVWMGTSTHYDSQKTVAYFPDKTPPDTVISMGGTWRRDYDDKMWFSIPNIYYGSIEWAVNMRTTTDGGIIIGFGDKYSGKKTIILMMEYTKTTD